MPVWIPKSTSTSSTQPGRALGQALSLSSPTSPPAARANTGNDINAADTALTAKLNSHSRVLTAGIQNLNDAISTTTLAQSALTSLKEISERQQELATLAADPLYTTSQRTALNTEANALVDEFNRIVGSTSYNGINLLDGSVSSFKTLTGETVPSFVTVELTEGYFGTAGDGTFQGQSTYSVGRFPVFVATQDLNGDGFDDVITADSNVAKVSVLLSNGDGSFQTAVSYTVGTNPRSIAFGDVNGDGKLDALVADQNSNTFSLLRGNGDGTFQARTVLSAGGTTQIRNAVLTDINGDGYLDIAATDQAGAGSLNLYLGNGDGTFQTRVSLAVGSSPQNVVAGDINGDGKIDLVTGDYSSGVSSVFIGNGNGTFQTRVTYVTGNPRQVQLADVNGDGSLDLLVSKNSGGSSAVSVLLNNGNGTFQSKVEYGIGSGSTVPFSLVTGDFNADGNLDVATANYTSDNISVLLGNGNGTFQTAVSYAAKDQPRWIAAGDFDNDGALDLVTANNNTDQGVSIYLGNTTTSTTLSYFNLLTVTGAENALNVIDRNLTSIETQLGQIDASTIRLNNASATLLSTTQSRTENTSSITSFSEAQLSAAALKEQILNQGSLALKAQANQPPNLVLQLLG